MKYFLRIVVTILIVGLVGVGVYFLFFNKPKDNDTFTKMSKLIDEKENSAVDDILKDLKGLETLPEFEKQKLRLLNDITTPIDVEGGSIYSYSSIETILDTALNNYYVYTQVASDVSSKSYKKVKKLVDEYQESYNTLETKLEDLKNYNVDYINEQDETLKNSMKYELTSKYSNISLYYKESLTNEAKLVLELKDFVNKYCFDNNFYTDSKIALLDLLMLDIISACNKSVETEIGYFIDLKQSIDVYLKCLNGEDIFTSSNATESEFLSNVETLFKGYEEGLEKVFSYTHAQRTDVVKGTFVSELKVEYVNSLKNVLKVLGY